MDIVPDGRGVNGSRTSKEDIARYEEKVLGVIAKIRGHSLVGRSVTGYVKLTYGRTGVLRIMPSRFGKQKKPSYEHRENKGHPIIFYNPVDITRRNDPFNIDDEYTTLLHEMVHAALQNKGQHTKLPGITTTFWTDMAEFAAITIVNMYRSEVKKGAKSSTRICDMVIKTTKRMAMSCLFQTK